MSEPEPSGASWVLDLLVVVALTGLGTLAIVAGLEITWLRAALTMPLVLFLPGYALVSVLFPAVHQDAAPPRQEGRALGFLGRLLLGMLASAAIVPALAYIFNFTPYGITPRPLAVAVATVTVSLSLLAIVRRASVPLDRRFRVPLVGGPRLSRYFQIQDENLLEPQPFEARNGRQLAFNVFLAVGVLALLASVAFAMTSPPDDEQFTESYLVMADGDGGFVADGYPDDFDEAASEPVYLAIENHEGQAMEFTVVVQVQAVDSDGDDSEVTDTQELDRISVSVDAGATEHVEYTVPADAGEDGSRLAFLLYRGDAPGEPADATAYRSVHLELGG